MNTRAGGPSGLNLNNDRVAIGKDIVHVQLHLASTFLRVSMQSISSFIMQVVKKTGRCWVGSSERRWRDKGV